MTEKGWIFREIVFFAPSFLLVGKKSHSKIGKTSTPVSSKVVTWSVSRSNSPGSFTTRYVPSTIQFWLSESTCYTCEWEWTFFGIESHRRKTDHYLPHFSVMQCWKMAKWLNFYKVTQAMKSGTTVSNDLFHFLVLDFKWIVHVANADRMWTTRALVSSVNIVR